MKTIADRWIDFAVAVLKPKAPASQRYEMRRAFYAGYSAALKDGVEIALESVDNDDAGINMMMARQNECLRFADDVKAGRA